MRDAILVLQKANTQLLRDALKLGIGLPNETEPEDTIPPMVYIHQEAIWEYQHLDIDLRQEDPPNEEMLNDLAIEGWEMAGLFVYDHRLHIYFKRLKRQ